MIEGFLLDVHVSSSGHGMTAWIISHNGQAHRCMCPWRPTLHVSGQLQHLQHLHDWLLQPEIRHRFDISEVRYMRARLDLEEYEIHEVLEVEVTKSSMLRRVGQHIEHRGNFTQFTLYSLDANLVQRFLHERGAQLFDWVQWDDGILTGVDNKHDAFPKLRALELRVQFDGAHHFETQSTPLASIEFHPLRYEEDFIESVLERPLIINLHTFTSVQAALKQVQIVMHRLNPDVVCTQNGDKTVLPALLFHAKVNDVILRLGRDDTPLKAKTQARTVWSYGQVLRKNAYHPLQGRLHLDIASSFIVREGGVAGLIELSRLSNQSAQDISRLSPGSVISSIQIRTAMDDGVLVPWKKNRPEDTKTALELLHSDRGGLYLDSTPGTFHDVIELDFASLFPSIIATRNISSETLNCPCCFLDSRCSNTSFLPLNPSLARDEIHRRAMEEQFGSGLFPQATHFALQVPGLQSYTCGRRFGFLGRVVGPLIERRRQLKSQRIHKGDRFDLQQNALKWLLVTCFGYTGYRNARFGRIEAHEAICAWAREILLLTIEEAQNNGWHVLHAVVDSVWLQDMQDRTKEKKISDAHAFAQKMSERIGIPLEYEDFYPIIAFVPSRVHGSGTLTKYWAWNGDDFKIRGIELRQHSTCQWIKTLQHEGLNLLTKNLHRPADKYSQQCLVHRLFHDACVNITQTPVPIRNFIVSRRIMKTTHERRVMNLTHAAILRAESQGVEFPPGGKIRYVVINQTSKEPSARIILAEEIPDDTMGFVDPDFYTQEAHRALWSLLSPFGWKRAAIEQRLVQQTLIDYS